VLRKSALVSAAAFLAAAAGLAGGQATGAPGATAVDTYITGKVIGRVAGRNLATVKIAWAYKCLGDKLGDATYEWTLKLIRKQPRPERTTTLGGGTSKSGSKTVQLSAGQYLPVADPFLCETERGAGSDKPEVGASVVVPDYCAWSVTSTRGLVQLEQGAVVRAAKVGSAVAPRDSLVTPKGAVASISSNGGDGTASVSGSSRVGVQAGVCSRGGGWTLSAAQGAISAAVKGGRRGAYRVTTPNAMTAGGPGARWKVSVARGVTKVAGLGGTVTVSGKKGPSVILTSGKSTVVAGSAPPAKPR